VWQTDGTVGKTLTTDLAGKIQAARSRSRA